MRILLLLHYYQYLAFSSFILFWAIWEWIMLIVLFNSLIRKLQFRDYQMLASYILSSFFCLFVLSIAIAILGFPGGSDGKGSTCNVVDPDSISGLERSPGEGNGNHSSLLAQRIPWTESYSPWSRKDLDTMGWLTPSLLLSLPSCYWFVDFCLLDLFICKRKVLKSETKLLYSSISFYNSVNFCLI